jgi:hypothetical protein
VTSGQKELGALYGRWEERLNIFQDEGGCVSLPVDQITLFSTWLGGFITLRKEENWRSLCGLVHTVMEDRICALSALSHNS